VRCAPGDPTTGFAALAGAGFSVDQVPSVPGFLCRIDGLPSPAQESCASTPPATAYWVYWHAPRGGSWTYSSSGAGTRNPAPGTVEGWSFAGPGGVSPPSAPPPPPPAAPKPTPTPRPPTPAPAAATSAATSRPVGATAAPTPRAATPAPPGSSPDDESPDASARAPASPSSRPTPTSAAVDLEAAPQPSPQASSGAVTAQMSVASTVPEIPLGMIAGVTIAAVVAGTAAFIVRRRGAGVDGGP
jgi:hypothetical protein